MHLPNMKSTTYMVEITTQKNEKYLSEGRNPLACLATRLAARFLASCQLRNFLLEFTEKCFAILEQSNCVTYYTWFWSLLFFSGIFFYHSFYGMAVRFQSKQGEGVSFYIQLCLLAFGRSNVFLQLKTKYSVFHFLHLGGTILNLIQPKINKKRFVLKFLLFFLCMTFKDWFRSIN